MPRIFDNINQHLLPALLDTLRVGERADFCVGYFNLRGWRPLADAVGRWRGDDNHCCRLLIGMQSTPSDELRLALRLGQHERRIDNQTVVREKRQLAEDFRQQLVLGVPTNADEATLRQLAVQLHARQVRVKVHLRYGLHAKLYLVHRTDRNNPITGFVGSSNLTFAGLSQQGELNLDVLEHDACHKLAAWFNDRWQDRWCLDISAELAAVIDESWAADRLVPPFHIYLRMAWYLAEDARVGMLEFQIPACFERVLFDFQIAAVKIAARYLNQRGGVLLGDVVGLGKSLMATALAKIFEDDHGTETLIICPKNLVTMWEDYAHRYELRAKVLSLARVLRELPEKTRRYRVVLIDESHNLRNKKGKRWCAIRDYLDRNDSRVILLSATPYNKNYADLAAQLALFLKEDTDLGIRPERLLAACGGEANFIANHHCPMRSLAAFEKSDDSDDWRDLMRLYLVRRTRGFIMQHYAEADERGRYLRFADGSKSYFPQRVPKNICFSINDSDSSDPYARLYAKPVVNAIAELRLPRYALGKYLETSAAPAPTAAQEQIIANLTRAGTRLAGFCRTNLFKRLESAGPTFLLSLERHILRNFTVLHALEQGLEIPIGAQDAALLDAADEDFDDLPRASAVNEDSETDDSDDTAAEVQTEVQIETEANQVDDAAVTEANFRARAAQVYASYQRDARRRFQWLPSRLFTPQLAKDLRRDALALLDVLTRCGEWNSARDAKLTALFDLITQTHPHEKLLIFTQFADTALELTKQLTARGVTQLAAVTGLNADPSALVWRFSPLSNAKSDQIAPELALRVLVATDVLSEGQNLQDCAIVVNYDLPWAIIRLIQRAGRVDRIGQRAERILCYSFVPADGVERILGLRKRVKQRLTQNAEVVGSDEAFFDDDEENKQLNDLYTEKSGVLDDDTSDGEIDLASYAYQIWQTATAADSSLIAKIETLPGVVYATKSHRPTASAPSGVLVFTRTPQGNNALAWLDEQGNSVTQSQLAILKAAACTAATVALPRQDAHHALTERGVAHILEEERNGAGALGGIHSIRARIYTRIKNYRMSLNQQRDLFTVNELTALDRVIDEIYRYPLLQTATEALNRQLRAQVKDSDLAAMLINLSRNKRLCIVMNKTTTQEQQLICSLGLCAHDE